MKFTKILLTTAILGFSLTAFHSTAWANSQDFNNGVEAFQSGDYKTAFKYFESLAKKGNKSAQYNIAFMYENGHGVKQSNAEALKWYKKAADQGFVDAQLGGGRLYFTIANDQDSLALELLKENRKSTKEIEQLKKQSQSNYREAAKWLEKAVDQGDERAEALLGTLYEFGMGVKKDEARAKELFEQSCSKGFQVACEQLE